MTRLPIATDLKTRTGVPAGKDARLNNAYVETKGEQSVVRRRPSAQGGIAVGTGTAQGGIGLTINGTPTFIGFWGDVLQTYTGSGTSWLTGSFYLQGDHVTSGFQDFWASGDNQGNDPTTSPSYWSSTYVPPVPRFTQTGSTNTVSTGESTVTAGGFNTTTRIYTTRDSGNVIIDSGSGTQVTPVLVQVGSNYIYSDYITPAAEAASNNTSLPNVFLYTPGYSYYKGNGTITYVGGATVWTGQVTYSPY